MNTPTPQAALVDAARAVCDRWDSPAWKWGDGPTADLIATLRAALAQAEAAQPVEPAGYAQIGLLNGRPYLRMVYDRTPYPPPADVARNLNLSPVYAAPQPAEAAPKRGEMAVAYEGWKEAAIAWNVCASVHQEWGKGKDALYTTRQADYVRHHEDARTKALAALSAQPQQPVSADSVKIPTTEAAQPVAGPIIAARYRNSPTGRWTYTDREIGSIEADGWREVTYLCDANAAPQPAEAAPGRTVTRETVREMLDDTREVFTASGSETPQDVRDVIEYVRSWLQVYMEKPSDAAQQKAKP